MNHRVRISRITISHIKNVEFGEVTFKDSNLTSTEGASILGIYGQNGSGKTAILDSLLLFRTLVSGEKLDNFTRYLINLEQKEATINVLLLMNLEDSDYEVDYTFTLKLLQKRVFIKYERLTYKESHEKIFKTLLVYEQSPNRLYSQSSIIFEPITSSTLSGIEKIVWEQLHAYARENILIINNFSNRDFRTKDEFPLVYYAGLNGYQKKTMRIKYGRNHLSQSDYELFAIIVKKISTLLEKIIPHVELEYKKYSSKNDEVIVELMTRRDDILLPLKYESIGIKKLVLVLGSLISMYNADNVMVAVDEIDAGIFEYLLGEIFLVLKEDAKGQLLFTSHNLRPLEILNPYQIVFTSANPKNRYVSLDNPKKKVNLRDVYIRSIELGGHDEDIYNHTDEFEIARAFRLAGKSDES